MNPQIKQIFLILMVLILIIILYFVLKNNNSKLSLENIETQNIESTNIEPQNELEKRVTKVIKFNGNCMHNQCDTLKNVINENKFAFNHNLYIPCGYDNINLEYDNFECDPNGMYFLIDGTDIMVAKDYLAIMLYSYYGKDAEKYIPKTWIPQNQESIENFKAEYNSTKLYIMKKNIQQQKDIQLFNNEMDILNTCNQHASDNYPYIVIQELLQNPYLVDGRKINLRVYVLAVKYNNEYRVYVYGDGFMYYTSERFVSNSTKLSVNITTGYIDREVYEKNPLTIKDFKNYLNEESRPLTPIEKKIQRYNMLSEYLTQNILDLIKNVFIIFNDKLGNKEKLKQNLKFQIYGVDVAVNEDLSVKIMEINKGPDLNSKDKRDCDLKYNLIKDAFKTVDIIDNDKKNDFIRII
jgi:hypothetical protein